MMLELFPISVGFILTFLCGLFVHGKTHQLYDCAHLFKETKIYCQLINILAPLHHTHYFPAYKSEVYCRCYNPAAVHANKQLGLPILNVD